MWVYILGKQLYNVVHYIATIYSSWMIMFVDEDYIIYKFLKIRINMCSFFGTCVLEFKE